MARRRRPVIIVHGGAGSFPEAERPGARAGCCAAARSGWAILAGGGSALDAAQAAVAALEDNPLFNAGTGATLNSEGRIELDASIMDGPTLRAGAVAAVPRIKNPVGLARRILEDGRHVLLAAEGALRFAQAAGIPECDEQELVVARQQRRWRERHGTVGAVALDRHGHIAAATSTGGLFDKLPGRVGDSAIIGAGTWADTVAGVSCTGTGETIMRTVLARTTAGYVAAGQTPQAAASRALRLQQAKTGATGGLIALDRQGRVGYARNTRAMPICWIADDKETSDD